jgi:putative membrane protein insertion efficiency factor
LRWLFRAAIILAAGALVVDAAGPPGHQVSARAALAGIHLYQRALSPVAARGGAACRFSPTCSRYAEAVISRDGIARGGWLALKRIVRCGPWTRAGTVDRP